MTRSAELVGSTAHHLMIESRNTCESPSVEDLLSLVKGLADAGESIDLFLIQNAVTMACPPANALRSLLGHPRVTIWVDEFSLALRLGADRPTHRGVRIGDAARLVELMVRNGCSPSWH